MPDNRYIPNSLSANDKPSWPIRFFKSIFSGRIEPETYSQSQGITMTKFGAIRAVRGKSGKSQFGEISSNNPMAIWRPGGNATIDPAKALANNKGFVYAAMNAIAREVMTIDWRLFEMNGEDSDEHTDHAVLDLLDTVNDSMISLAFKYLLSACLTLTGNAYVYMEGVSNDLDEPKALHLMPPDRVRPVIDRRSWPYQLVGFKMKLETTEMVFKPYEVIHLQLPNPSDFFEGKSPVDAGAEYIDNDNYAQEFNRKFFINGARPAGFLETEMIAETQIETLKIGFANMHQGIDNMQGIGVLPKGVKWAGVGSSPKDMDFPNLSADSKERILAMFGVSRTILGTAESDTNRATAETADYVFSKRVVKPHMLLICAYLTERLLPRYGDNLYLSFIDPVPEDRAARTDEMTKASGGVPLITQNEAREEFLGMGPTDGGDKLLIPNTMTPSGETPQPSDDGEPSDDKPAKQVMKAVRTKAANGLRVAYRPSRTKLIQRAKQRREMATDLANKITAKLKKDAEAKKFESTKEQDEAIWKEFSEQTAKTEKEIIETVQRLNAEQKKQVLENLPHALKKAIDPSKLFDLDSWVSITTDALTPAIESLYEHEGKMAATEIGKPELNPLSDVAARNALHESIAKMSQSYQETTLATLEAKINDGLSTGAPLSDISRTVEEIYEWRDTSGAERVAKTESFRTANASLKAVWQQSGVVKTLKWYTANNPCPFCQAMNGKTISVDSNFFGAGDTLTVGDDSMTMDYGDVGAPPLHPNCMCFVRPDEVSL